MLPGTEAAHHQGCPGQASQTDSSSISSSRAINSSIPVSSAVIASPEPVGPVAVAPFENPALASGGTGDVLAGAIGALLAQGLTPFDAARLGVYLHGAAGDGVRERFGDSGLLASDLPDGLAIARKRLAVVAERRRLGARLGFGAREPGLTARS